MYIDVSVSLTFHLFIAFYDCLPATGYRNQCHIMSSNGSRIVTQPSLVTKVNNRSMFVGQNLIKRNWKSMLKYQPLKMIYTKDGSKSGETYMSTLSFDVVVHLICV